MLMARKTSVIAGSHGVWQCKDTYISMIYTLIHYIYMLYMNMCFIVFESEDVCVHTVYQYFHGKRWDEKT